MPSFGVEISGLDLSRPIEADNADTLRALFAEHRLLLLHDPNLSDAGQANFARLFGETSQRERNKETIASADNQFVSNARPDGIFGKGELDFHMDQLFLEHPLTALILYAVEIPASGGGTKFVDTEATYRKMPDSLKSRINGLHCRHARDYDAQTTKDWNVVESSEDSPSWSHPLTRVDPDTGQRAIWVNRITTLGIEGLPDKESQALIDEIRGYLYDDALTYHHRWNPGDLILWDNQVLQHARTAFDPDAPRTLRRTAII
jgi:taurine dioxygenase